MQVPFLIHILENGSVAAGRLPGFLLRLRLCIWLLSSIFPHFLQWSFLSGCHCMVFSAVTSSFRFQEMRGQCIGFFNDCIFIADDAEQAYRIAGHAFRNGYIIERECLPSKFLLQNGNCRSSPPAAPSAQCHAWLQNRGRRGVRLRRIWVEAAIRSTVCWCPAGPRPQNRGTGRCPPCRITNPFPGI